MMRLIYARLEGPDGRTEAEAILRDVPAGHVRIRHPDGLEEIQSIDDLPAHWQEQLRGLNVLGRRLP